MTNEEIISMCDRGEALEYDYGATVTHIDNIPELLNLARADEREKITEETVKEYFAGFSGKETALIVLNYLLRGGITDDDLRGLRLQWIKEQPECVDVWISWDGRDGGTVDAWHKDEPRKGENDMFYGSSDINGKHSHISELHKDFAKLFNISPSECAKFKIVRCE